MSSSVSPAVAAKLAARAAVEPDVEVRSQLACSAKRLPARDALPIVAALLTHGEDAHDIHIPLLLWWAIEAKVATDPDAVLELFEDRAVWDRPIAANTIEERLMRRFAAAGTRKDLDRCARLLAMAPGVGHRKALMAGFESAFAGRSLAGLPESARRRAGAVQRPVGDPGPASGQAHGGSRGLESARERAGRQGPGRSSTSRFWARSACRVQSRSCSGLGCHSPDNALRAAALAALVNYDDPTIAAEVLKTYGSLSEDVLSAAQNLLVARRGWAIQLLEAIDERTIDPRTLLRETVEKLLLLGDARINELTTRHFGAITPATSAELQSQISRLASVVRSGPGVPKPGKQIFLDQCARCHALFGKGGKVGPDLTTYRRDDLEAMLLNIVNPSAEIREGYASQVVATTDGRTLTGILVDQDRNVVVLRGSDGKEADAGERLHRGDQAFPGLAHARGFAQEPGRAAGTRPVRLPEKYPAVN